MNRSTNTLAQRTGLRVVAAVLIAAGAVLLGGAPADAHGAHQVEIKQYMYMPMSLTVEQGETVTWTNQDAVEHNVVVTSGPASFSSPMLAKGESWSHAFTTAGPYSYICSVHPDMKATVTVTPAPVLTPAVTHPATPKAQKVQKAQKPGARAAAAPAAEIAAGTSAGAAAPTLVSAPSSSATLQPLILVVGASVFAMMLCLLLMASRPVSDSPRHVDEP